MDLADVKMGGQGLPVTRELVTLAAWNMARVKMGSVNVTKAGMGNTAQLVSFVIAWGHFSYYVYHK